MKRVILMSIVIISISSFANAHTVSCDKSILTTIIEPIPSKGKLSKENFIKRAKKIDPFDKKARTAVVLGWVTVGLLIVLLITAVIFISMMSFNFYII